jgi:hypothetical protein
MKFPTILVFAAGAVFAQVPPQTGAQFQVPGWMASASRTDAQSGPVTGKPFSGTETRHSANTLADGSKTNITDTTAIYRDGEGRMRMESGTNVAIYDPVARMEYHLNAQRKTFTKQEIANSVGSTRIIVTGNSISTSNSTGNSRPRDGEEDLGIQVVNGIMARGTRTTITIPAGTMGTDHDLKVVNDKWYSDALGILMKSSNNDPRFGLTTYELTNLNQSTPDPQLFKVPDGYTEVQPTRLPGKE